jgi:isopenicillin N synthase-like dioxygenase
MRRFFALSDDDPGKQAINVTNKENTNGWMPMFQEPAYQPGTLAHVESFDCGHERLDEPQSGYATNRWPDIPGFRENVLNARDELTGSGMAVLRALAEAMQLDASFFADRCNTHELSTMRLLHYPANNDDVDLNANVGIAAHTDFECITLLSQTAPGLELMNRDGNWVDAPASDDRLIVLLGDMIERWTNGIFKATGHRVRCRDWQRFSVVLFFGVNDDVVVAPQNQFISHNRPAQFPPIGQKDHSREQLQAAEDNRQKLATA